MPAVLLITGFANGGKAAFSDFMAHHYHKPVKPSWNPGDFFGAKFAKP